MLFVVEAASAEGATLRLSDGTNVDDIVLTAGTGIDFSNTSAGAIQIDVDASEITSAIQNQLTDATLVSSTDGSNVDLTLTGPGSETDVVQLTAGTNVTITQSGGNNVTFAVSDSDIQGALTDATLVSSTNGSNVNLTLTGPGSETDVVTLTAGTNVTITQASGNNVTFAVTDANIQAALTDVTLVASTDGDNVDLTITGPGSETDVVQLTAGSGIGISQSGGNNVTFTATSPSNLNLTDESSDTTCFLTFAKAATGDQAIHTDADSLRYNANTKTLTVPNLTVDGTTTTVSTTNLTVEDLRILAANPDTPAADDATQAGNADGAGLVLNTHLTAGTADANYAGVTWLSTGELTGWRFRDTAGATDFAAAVMEFSSNSTPPSGDAGGVGSFHYDTGDDKLYIRTE